MTSDYAIHTHGLTKTYRTPDGQTVEALRGMDLTVHNGEIYALLGPNGAGKTTTISILTTLLLPTTGRAQVVGFDVVADAAQVRRRIGVTFQEIILDQDLTGRHVLDFHGQLYGLAAADRRSRIHELAKLVELEDVLDRQVKGYSGGMKRRLELARGLMTRPQLLFLDEPTQGLDPHNRHGIWRYIRRLRDEMGVTLLLTTHYMDEAETLADRVGIVDHGQMVVEGTPAALVAQMGADIIALEGSGNVAAFTAALQAEAYVAQVNQHVVAQPAPNDEDAPSADAYVVQVGVDQGDRRLLPVLSVAAAQGFQVQSVNVNRPTLGQVFLAHTGYALRD